MNFRKLIVFIFLLGCGLANAQQSEDKYGFDDEYKVYTGSSNNDGLTDLLIARAASKTTLIKYKHYAIPLELTPVRDFILENNGDGTFDIIESNVKNLSAWTEVDVAPRIRDFNLDGRRDLILDGVSAVINGAHNQIVFAPFPNQTSRIPTALTPMDEDFESFFRDIIAYVADPNYFNRPSQSTIASAKTIKSPAGFKIDPQNLNTLNSNAQAKTRGIDITPLSSNIQSSNTVFEVLLIDGAVSPIRALARYPLTATCIPPSCFVVSALPRSTGECFVRVPTIVVRPNPAYDLVGTGGDLCSIEPFPGFYWLIVIDGEVNDGIRTRPEDIEGTEDYEGNPIRPVNPVDPDPVDPDPVDPDPVDPDPVDPDPVDPEPVDPEPEVVFDERARNVSLVIERLNANCPGTISDADAEMVNGIATDIIGAAARVNHEIIGLNNAIPHPAFPSSVIFDESSLTYHHYDVRHKLCSFTNSNSVERICPPLATMKGEHYLYTLPTRKQIATPPQTDGSFIDAYGPILTSVNTGFLSEAIHPRGSYVFRVGRVTQQRIATSGTRYPQAFENITDASHTAFPGIIVRALEVAPDGIYSFTHGEGENRAFCADGLSGPTGPDLASLTTVRFIRLIVTFANDVFGFATFHDLDQRLIDDNR